MEDHDRDILASIELHLDVLLDCHAAGIVSLSPQEYDLLHSLSERIGGFVTATESPAHAIAYERRLRTVRARLATIFPGVFADV